MIYSIGYQALTPAELLATIDALDIDALVDVRSSPNSRRPGFSRKALASLLGARYDWCGDTLGGRGDGPTGEAVQALARSPFRIMLMCLEESPGDCHRHDAIAVPLLALGVDVRHIYRDEVVTASDLAAAIEAGGDYDCVSLADEMADAAAA